MIKLLSPKKKKKLEKPKEKHIVITPKKREDSEEFEKIKTKVADIDNRLQRIEASFELMKKTSEELKKQLQEFSSIVEDLSSMYEIVINQINPFTEKNISIPSPKKPKEEKIEVSEEKPKIEVEEKIPTGGEQIAKQIFELEKEAQKEGEKEEEKEIEGKEPDIKKILASLFWIKYLVNNIKGSHVLSAIRYYKELGWLNEEQFNQLKSYLDGIVLREDLDKTSLDSNDHLVSMELIKRIKD